MPPAKATVVGDGIRAVLDEGVRAGDVVHAGVAGVLGDRAGAGSADGSPQSIDAVKSLAGKPQAPGRIGIGAVKVPTIALTFWKPSTVLIATAGPGVITSGPTSVMLMCLVVDRVDDARAGDA